MKEWGNHLCYKSLFSRSFLIDKFSYESIYQCPKIEMTTLRFDMISQVASKVKLCRLMLMFYIVAGQKPKVLTKDFNLRGVRKKRVLGMVVNLKDYISFLDFIIIQELPRISSFKAVLLREKGNTILTLNQKVQEKCILYRVLGISEVNYYIHMKVLSLSKYHTQALLLCFKVPCRLT